MAIKTKELKGAIVAYDDLYANRWIDAFGENVRKFELGMGFPTDDTTGDPSQFTFTPTEVAGTSTAVNSLAEGYSMIITNGTNENDGSNLQLKGSPFVLTRGCPLYFGAKLKISDATQSDLLVGLCERDTTLMGAHAVTVTDDGVYFSKIDAVTLINFNNELGGVVGTTASEVPMDAVDHIYEIYWDGDTLFAYVDNILVTTIADGLANEELTPSIAFYNGEALSKVCSVAWMRCIQLR